MRAVVVVVLLLGCRAQPGMEAKPATVQPPVTEPRTTGELCRADGFDFAYYDRDLGEEGLVLLCGTGPGTPCEAGQRRCEEHAVVLCERGKLTRVDCRGLCRQGGATMTHLHDDGTCGEVDGVAECRCCDAGEPGCPSESPQPRRVVPLPPTPT